MKIFPFLSRAVLAIAFTVALMGGSLLSTSAFAQGCPGNPEQIVTYSDCAPCHTDLNNDGKATAGDLLLLSKCLQQGICDGGVNYDVNGDGTVNQDDLSILKACVMKGLTTN
jgi:hypothetical protein